MVMDFVGSTLSNYDESCSKFETKFISSLNESYKVKLRVEIYLPNS